ncbi:UNVERIFIED_CONTAM: hypothetical protein HDU68_008103 [Siphonaria sp. JEL0065]|nr:hypothetical protein HDU68_008103 [Siphonaria sp. JEL0065]
MSQESEPTAADNKLRILVVGGGIGGIALARKLSQSPHFAVTIYERDEGPTTRDQGLVIGLRQEALDILLSKLEWPHLWNLFQSTGSATGLCLMNKASFAPMLIGQGFMTLQVGEDVKSSLIPRSSLRNEMMRGLDHTRVQVVYGKQVLSYKETEDEVVVTTSDGISCSFDVLVGADGARSKIRNQRCPALEPVEIGYWNNAGSILLTPEKAHSVAANLMVAYARNCLTRKPGKRGASFMSFVYTDHAGEHLLWSLSMPQALADDFGLKSDLDKDEMLAATIKFSQDCFPQDITALFKLTDVSELFPGYKFYSVLPEVVASNPLGQELHTRVTLIGDAAHKTTTQAGLGATAALQDAILLAEHLERISGRSQVTRYVIANALRQYEVKMSVNAKAVVGSSVARTRDAHSTNTIQIAVANSIISFMGYLLGFYYFVSGK